MTAIPYVRTAVLLLKARILVLRLRLHLARGRPDPAYFARLKAKAIVIETEILMIRRARW